VQTITKTEVDDTLQVL